MRPLLVLAGCDLFNVGRDRAIRVALAVECIHAYSLIHDDLPCMDDDDLRRGKPTVHRAFDECTAILAGDRSVPRRSGAGRDAAQGSVRRSELALEPGARPARRGWRVAR
jgi:geranylgeranyl pyrophosphate synthase